MEGYKEDQTEKDNDQKHIKKQRINDSEDSEDGIINHNDYDNLDNIASDDTKQPYNGTEE